MVKPMDGAHRPRSRFCHGYLRSIFENWPYEKKEVSP